MNKFVVTLVAAGLLSTTAAMAQSQVSFTDLDADANGELSLTELQVAWPDLTEADFASADLDVSGGLNIDEVASIQTAATGTTTLPGTPERPTQSLRAPAVPDVAPAVPGVSVDASTFPDALTEN